MISRSAVHQALTTEEGPFHKNIIVERARGIASVETTVAVDPNAWSDKPLLQELVVRFTFPAIWVLQAPKKRLTGTANLIPPKSSQVIQI